MAEASKINESIGTKLTDEILQRHVRPEPKNTAYADYDPHAPWPVQLARRTQELASVEHKPSPNIDEFMSEAKTKFYDKQGNFQPPSKLPNQDIRHFTSLYLKALGELPEYSGYNPSQQLAEVEDYILGKAELSEIKNKENRISLRGFLDTLSGKRDAIKNGIRDALDPSGKNNIDTLIQHTVPKGTLPKPGSVQEANWNILHQLRRIQNPMG